MPRKQTIYLLELMDQGLVSRMSVAEMCLSYMSEDDVRDMTITQGKLLIKLIDRETLNTSYELIKQYRGGFSAAFWQSIARIFGTNLKAEYDPYGEDAIMEIILQEIETGKL